VGRPNLRVRLTLQLDSDLPIPYLAFEEPLPFGLEVTEGKLRGEAASTAISRSSSPTRSGPRVRERFGSRESAYSWPTCMGCSTTSIS